eukprot:1503178-Pleurochrysis_carterae.AAC.1
MLCFSSASSREQDVRELLEQVATITFTACLARMLTHPYATTTLWIDFVEDMKHSALSFAKSTQTKYMDYLRNLDLPSAFLYPSNDVDGKERHSDTFAQ